MSEQPPNLLFLFPDQLGARQCAAASPQIPVCMTGFEHKTLHLRHDADASVRFRVEADFMGDGEWGGYTALDVAPGACVPHGFPTGYSAHRVRVRVDHDGQATAHFTCS